MEIYSILCHLEKPNIAGHEFLSLFSVRKYWSELLGKILRILFKRRILLRVLNVPP